jgi:hypothetical protein
LGTDASQYLEEYNEANMAFHKAIIRLSGCELMSDLAENLFIHMRSICSATMRQNDRAKRSIRDHLILESSRLLNGATRSWPSAWYVSTRLASRRTPKSMVTGWTSSRLTESSKAKTRSLPLSLASPSGQGCAVHASGDNPHDRKRTGQHLDIAGPPGTALLSHATDWSLTGRDLPPDIDSAG